MTGYGLPYVVLDRMVQGAEAPVLVTDIFLEAYLATKHSIELGHHRISCLTRLIELHHSIERVRGFKAALIERGIEIDESLIVGCGSHMQDGYDGAKKLIQHSPPPTAMFAYNDVMVIVALRAAYELGINVQQDLSIVGFDNILQSAFTCPALTTISQPKFELGYQSVELLLEFMNKQASPGTHISPLPVELIIRESTQSINGGA
jgi:DNA-binding LacI/PurR family transcriptional regulator